MQLQLDKIATFACINIFFFLVSLEIKCSKNKFIYIIMMNKL